MLDNVAMGATTIPIPTGENEYTRYGFRDLIAQGAVSIFNTDATANSMCGEVYKTTLSLNDDGTVSPPDVPRIGIEPNYEALAPHLI